VDGNSEKLIRVLFDIALPQQLGWENEALRRWGNQRLRKRFRHFSSDARPFFFLLSGRKLDHHNSSFPTKRVPLQLIILC